MTSPTSPGRVPTERLTLEFPRSLAVYETYEDAQRAVDYLSDHEFPVQNVLIVGTDLKQVERVTGRLTWGKVVAGGLLSGMWLGAFVGLIFGMFGAGFALGVFLSVVLTGALFGVVWAALGYALTRGQRDFTSVSQVVATRYEVLVEHALFDRAREMLAQLPGGRGTLSAPTNPASSGAPARPNPYEGRYGVRTDEKSQVAGDVGPGSSTARGATAMSPRSGHDVAEGNSAPSEAPVGAGDESRTRSDGQAEEPRVRTADERSREYEGRYGVRLDDDEVRRARDEAEQRPSDPRS